MILTIPVKCGTSQVPVQVQIAMPKYKGHSAYFTGNATNVLPVPAGAIGDITSIHEVGTGDVYFSLDGTPITPAPGPEKGRVSGTSVVSVLDVDLSLFRIAGSSPASAYTVTYRIRM